MSNLATIGGNNPPSPLDFAHEATNDLGKWLLDNPVIQTTEQAKAGALWVERARKTIQDVEDERKRQVAPLNAKVKLINDETRDVRDPLDGVLSELRRRLTDFAGREEAKRIREAELARQAALDAEIEARRAEEAEREAKQNATLGEITDVAAAIQEADGAFKTYAQLDRAAQLAERDTHIRLPSQLGGKALGLREKETLHVTNMLSAVEALMLAQMTEHLREAILKAARVYRKARGELPPGVRSEISRSI